VYTAKLVEEGGDGAYIATVRLAESSGGGGDASYYIGEVKSDSSRNTNLFRLVRSTPQLHHTNPMVDHAYSFNMKHL
jgi:hypothetical protein